MNGTTILWDASRLRQNSSIKTRLQKQVCASFKKDNLIVRTNLSPVERVDAAGGAVVHQS